MNKIHGTVYLVGAGPGSPELITVRGQRLLAEGDVIVHDRLVSHALLAAARKDAEIIDVRKVCGHGDHAQDRINAILIDRAKRARTVVRLKGGDPFVFGRGWEEWCACRGAGIRCIVVPGITSALAVPATMGIPTTCRGTGRSFAVIAAQGCESDDAAGLDYEALAKIATVVILMGRTNLPGVARSLIKAGRDPGTPAACIERGTMPQQRSIVATLATIAEAADREGVKAPVVTIVGEVVRCAKEYDEHLGAMTSSPVESEEPLAGKRVLITRTVSSSRELRERLTAYGAHVIEAPMLGIGYDTTIDRQDAALRNLQPYSWIAFASVHGVRGFFEGLKATGRDARALASCKVAAIGPITASAILKRGIMAEFVANPYSATALLDGILADTAGKPDRVLCPCGDTTGPRLAQAFSRAGLTADEIVVYRTIALTPADSVLRAIGNGVDAVLLCSPSAARRFAELSLNIGGATIACIGPSTASAATAMGMRVDVTAKDYTDHGLVSALVRHFRSACALAKIKSIDRAPTGFHMPARTPAGARG